MDWWNIHYFLLQNIGLYLEDNLFSIQKDTIEEMNNPECWNFEIHKSSF